MSSMCGNEFLATKQTWQQSKKVMSLNQMKKVLSEKVQNAFMDGWTPAVVLHFRLFVLLWRRKSFTTTDEPAKEWLALASPVFISTKNAT